MGRRGLVILIWGIIIWGVFGAGSSSRPWSIICKVEVSELGKCLPALMGQKPPMPTKACCIVVRKADLRCLCNYKKELGKFGISQANALALPNKCGMKKLPRECTTNR